MILLLCSQAQNPEISRSGWDLEGCSPASPWGHHLASLPGEAQDTGAYLPPWSRDCQAGTVFRESSDRGSPAPGQPNSCPSALLYETSACSSKTSHSNKNLNNSTRTAAAHHRARSWSALDRVSCLILHSLIVISISQGRNFAAQSASDTQALSPALVGLMLEPTTFLVPSVSFPRKPGAQHVHIHTL